MIALPLSAGTLHDATRSESSVVITKEGASGAVASTGAADFTCDQALVPTLLVALTRTS